MTAIIHLSPVTVTEVRHTHTNGRRKPGENIKNVIFFFIIAAESLLLSSAAPETLSVQHQERKLNNAFLGRCLHAHLTSSDN